MYKSEQTKMNAPFSIPVLCSERGSFCCESSSRFLPGAAVRHPGSHRETPFSNCSGDSGTYDHCRKTWMAAFLRARFVAGYAKTVCPAYIEKHRKKQQKTGSGFLMWIEYSHPVPRDQGGDGKVELIMKKYVKPSLKCLGLLRLVTKFSF